jgi:DNA-binding transcriptional LysR family regulator
MERYLAFQAVAQEGSFSRAAERLRRTQPTISQAVQALEEELGQRLFSKRRGGVELSEAGRVLLAHVDRALLELESGRSKVEAVGEASRGRLVLVASDSVTAHLLPNVIARFRGAYPRVTLSIRNRPSGAAVRMVAAGRADLALVSCPVGDRRLSVTQLSKIEDVLVCHSEHALAGMRRPTPQMFVRHPVLALDRGSHLRQVLEQQILRPHGARVAMELGSLEVIEQMVLAQLGISLVPRFAVRRSLRGRRMHAVSFPSGGELRRLSAVHRKRAATAAARAMLGMLEEHLPSDGMV